MATTYTSQIEYQWIQYIDTWPWHIAVIEPKLTELNALYETVKPESTPEQPIIYSFISMDVTQDDTATWGILNCRVNGEQSQIRF